MNLGDLDVYSVQYNRPRLLHSPSRHSIAITNDKLEGSEADYVSDSGSSVTANTVIRWTTPPESLERQQLQPKAFQSEATIIPIRVIEKQNSNATLVPAAVRFDEEQIKTDEAEASGRGTRMDDFDSGPPTPNADDTPYIRFAIDQLTRDEDVLSSQRPLTGDSEESYPVERIVPDQGLGYVQSIRKVKGPSMVQISPKGALLPIQSHHDRDVESLAAKSELFIPVEPEVHSPRHPNLTWTPRILGRVSMLLLMALCLLMIAALIACAVYSSHHSGVVTYNNNIYGGQYFLFQFFPQILAAILLFYMEAVMTAVARVVPYAMMASNNSQRRNNALFIGLYPRSLLLPRFEYFHSGAPLLGACSVMLWPAIFTIPLQSCLFSVVMFDGKWRWTAVQGVAWTLVAIYVIALIALIGITGYFFRRATGLIWDPRSLADIVALLPRSNSLDEYQDTEVLETKAELKTALDLTSERLGYWRTSDVTKDIFYCIGEEGAPTRRYTIQSGRAQEKTPVMDYKENNASEFGQNSPQPLLSRGTNSSLLAKVYSPAIRFRYIPWYLNDTFIILWPIAGFFLLVALIIVSFLPSTALRNGFRPLVNAAPEKSGFSPANCLYSFVPSLLGLLLYSALSALTQTLYRLAPWAALSRPSGAIASESILLDYTASPFLSNIVATITHGHYLLAILSALSPLMILLPILAGGLFFPLFSPSRKIIVMLPNLPAFYIMLCLLILYFLALLTTSLSLLRTSRRYGARKLHNLPHPVTCLAEIISFIYGSGLIHDAAFRAVRSKSDLMTRLVGRRERVSMDSNGYSGSLGKGKEVRYYFGIFRGRDQRSHLGIERVGRAERQIALGAGGQGASMSKFSV